MGANVVLVGLDGADRTEIARLADGGQLPVLARMRGEGLWGKLDAFEGLGDDAAWSSFATGVGPGRHGRRFYRHYRTGTYDWEPFTRQQIRAVPFWDALSAHGRRFAVLDVPKAPIGTDPANLVIADWMSHGAHEPSALCHPDSVWRPQLAGWLDSDDTTWDCHAARSPSDFVSSLCDRAALRTDFAIDVMGRAHWDALVLTFAETHCAGHGLWDDFERVGAVYRAVDTQLGRIIGAAGPSSTVIVFSLLGMGPNNPTDELADAVLHRLASETPESLSRSRRVLESVGARVPRGIRVRLPARIRSMSSDARAREFGSQLFWRVPTDLPHTPIRLNVAGREPYGKIAPGSDFDATCDELRREFLALRDPESGRPLVRDVIVARDAYPGDAPEDFADLHVVWDRTQPLVAASSLRIGELHVEPVLPRPGEHRDGGWFAATGPSVTHRVAGEPASVLDFAPTVARLVDAPFDGEGVAIPGVSRDPPAIRSPAIRPRWAPR